MCTRTHDDWDSSFLSGGYAIAFDVYENVDPTIQQFTTLDHSRQYDKLAASEFSENGSQAKPNCGFARGLTNI